MIFSLFFGVTAAGDVAAFGPQYTIILAYLGQLLQGLVVFGHGEQYIGHRDCQLACAGAMGEDAAYLTAYRLIGSDRLIQDLFELCLAQLCFGHFPPL